MAHHEAGHAVAAIAMYGPGVVQRVSIVSRGESSGRTEFTLLRIDQGRGRAIDLGEWPVWYWRKGRPVRKKAPTTVDVVRAFAIFEWAGVVAEAKHGGVDVWDPWEHALSSDLITLEGSAAEFEVSLPVPKDPEEHWEFVHAATVVVLRWWPAVERVASALLEEDEIGCVDQLVLRHSA